MKVICHGLNGGYLQEMVVKKWYYISIKRISSLLANTVPVLSPVVGIGVARSVVQIPVFDCG